MDTERSRNEDRIAVVGIIVEQTEAAAAVNEILHQYSSYIIGRMGLPYREKNVSIISVVIDAPADIISAMSGKLGRLQGVSSKALYSRANR
jgi:putative iron-only hydrogenase system regulator